MRLSAVIVSLFLIAVTGCDPAPGDGEQTDSGQVTPAPGAAADARESRLQTFPMTESAAEAPAAAPAPPNGVIMTAAADHGSSTAPAMVIRTGSASLEVDSLEPAIVAVRALVQRLGGYVGNTVVQAGSESVRSATLELRVPSERFDEVVGGLAPLGKVEWVNVQAEDVGEQYVDLTARADNAKRLESRLIDLLAARTGKLSDVLAVERELSRVREEIERIEGRLRFLRTRVATSSLSITVHEPGPIVGRPGDHPIADALRQAWRNAVAVVAGLIAAAGGLLPLAVLAAAGWWGWRRVAPRRRRAAAAATAAPAEG